MTCIPCSFHSKEKSDSKILIIIYLAFTSVYQGPHRQAQLHFDRLLLPYQYNDPVIRGDTLIHA